MKIGIDTERDIARRTIDMFDSHLAALSESDRATVARIVGIAPPVEGEIMPPHIFRVVDACEAVTQIVSLECSVSSLFKIIVTLADRLTSLADLPDVLRRLADDAAEARRLRTSIRFHHGDRALALRPSSTRFTSN